MNTKLIKLSVHVATGLSLVMSAFADGTVVSVATNLTRVTSPQDGTTAYAATAAESYLADLRQHKNESDPNGTALSVNVDAGKALTIGRLRGGRGRAATMTKTGAGTLRLLDAAPYGGTVILQDGVLDLSLRKIPTAAELPSGPILHVDASDLSNLETEEDGKTYVTYWKNAADAVGEVKGLRQYARTELPKHFRPWLVRDAMGPGLNVVDFGIINFDERFEGVAQTDPATPWPYEHGSMSYVTTEASADAPQTTTLKNARTLIAVSGAQRGGGTILAYEGAWGWKPFDRGVNWVGSRDWKAGVGNDYVYVVDQVSYPASVWQDGLPTLATKGYETPGFHVIAIRQDPQGAESMLFSGANGVGYDFHGGCILGEVFVYDRELSETEVRDVQAYLMNKWFKMAASGYARTDGLADLQKVTADGQVSLHVEAGRTSRIDTLRIEKTAVVKVTGGGTLEVFDAEVEGKLVYTDGSVVRLADRPDCDSLCALPPGMSFRLDATATGSLVFSSDGATGAVRPDKGTNLVSRITSYGGGNVMGINGIEVDEFRPRYAENVLNGLPMLDFGWKLDYGRMLDLYPMDGIRDVFVVHKGDSGDTAQGAVEDHSFDGGPIIGSNDFLDFGAGNENKAIFDYFRSANKKGVPGANWALVGNNADCMGGGWADAYVGNVFYANGLVMPSGDFEQIEIVAKCPTHASAVKCSIGYSQFAGGGFVGELVAYERTLTPREQAQMRNYLAKKWFKKDDAELEPLPPKPASRAGLLAPTYVEVDGMAEISVESSWSNAVVKGSGTLVKSGNGVLQVKDFLSFTGEVAVAAGKLAVTGVSVPASGKLETEGLIAHFDANEGVTCNESGLVTKWTSDVGGVSARAEFGVTCQPNGLNGMPIVKMDDGFMRFYDDGQDAATKMQGIKTVLWMLGSQEGGGYVLGGGSLWGFGGYDWARDSNASGDIPGRNAGDHILCNSTAPCIQGGFWRKNFEPIKPKETALSGEWDMLSFVFNAAWSEEEDRAMSAEATGFAFDDRSGGIFSGHQRLAEVVLYDRCLDESELLAAESYLMAKWGVNNAVPYGTNDVRLVIAADGVLDCGGVRQYFAAVQGAGAVVNGGVKTATLVYDFANPSVLTTESFQFLDGFSVELHNVPATLELGLIPIVSSDEFVDAEKLTKQAFSGEPLPDSVRAKLVIRKGKLCLAVCGGMAVLIR